MDPMTRAGWAACWKTWARGGLAALASVVAATMGAAEEWVRIKTPHFTVISEASEAKAREWATQFELFRHTIARVLPVNPALVDPVTLVLFRSERSLRPFKPTEDGKPAQVAGFFVRLPTRNTIALAVEGARADVRRVIFHEAVHWHLGAAARTLPRWMEEGLAEVFSSFGVAGNDVELGALPGDHLRHLRNAKPMSVPELLAVDAVRFSGKHHELAQVFYFQSWALMHSLLFDSGDAGLANFGKFLAEPASEEGAAPDLARHLQITVGDLERRLDGYLQAKRLNLRRLTIDRTAIEGTFTVEPAEAAEVDLALGNLLLGAARGAEAEPYFHRVRRARPADARGYEGAAACAVANHRPEEARALLDAAVTLPNATFLGFFTLAQVHAQRAATVQLPSEDSHFSAAITHVQQALQRHPRYLPAYELMAALATLLPQANPILGAWLQEGRLQFPQSREIRMGSAAHAFKSGDPGQGRSHLAAARRLTSPDNEQARREIESLAMQFDPSAGRVGKPPAAAP